MHTTSDIILPSAFYINPIRSVCIQNKAVTKVLVHGGWHLLGAYSMPQTAFSRIPGCLDIIPVRCLVSFYKYDIIIL